MVRIALVVIALALAANPVRAEPTDTLSIEPVFLVLPMAELTAEHMVTPQVSFAATGGIGHAFLPIGNMMYDLGGQGNVYLMRHFSGVHLGALIKYMWGDSGGAVFPGGPSVMDTSMTEREVGIYAGYKWITRRGFSATIQYGVGRLDITSTDKNSDLPRSQIIPIGQATLGWSF